MSSVALIDYVREWSWIEGVQVPWFKLQLPTFLKQNHDIALISISPVNNNTFVKDNDPIRTKSKNDVIVDWKKTFSQNKLSYVWVKDVNSKNGDRYVVMVINENDGTFDGPTRFELNKYRWIVGNKDNPLYRIMQFMPNTAANLLPNAKIYSLNGESLVAFPDVVSIDILPFVDVHYTSSDKKETLETLYKLYVDENRFLTQEMKMTYENLKVQDTMKDLGYTIYENALRNKTSMKKVARVMFQNKEMSKRDVLKILNRENLKKELEVAQGKSAVKWTYLPYYTETEECIRISKWREYLQKKNEEMIKEAVSYRNDLLASELLLALKALDNALTTPHSKYPTNIKHVCDYLAAQCDAEHNHFLGMDKVYGHRDLILFDEPLQSGTYMQEIVEQVHNVIYVMQFMYGPKTYCAPKKDISLYYIDLLKEYTYYRQSVTKDEEGFLHTKGTDVFKNIHSISDYDMRKTTTQSKNLLHEGAQETGIYPKYVDNPLQFTTYNPPQNTKQAELVKMLNQSHNSSIYMEDDPMEDMFVCINGYESIKVQGRYLFYDDVTQKWVTKNTIPIKCTSTLTSLNTHKIIFDIANNLYYAKFTLFKRKFYQYDRLSQMSNITGTVRVLPITEISVIDEPVHMPK